MSENKSSSVSSIGFVGFLTLLFIALKLTGYINWAWVWIVSPIWLSMSVGFLLLMVVYAALMWKDR